MYREPKGTTRTPSILIKSLEMSPHLICPIKIPFTQPHCKIASLLCCHCYPGQKKICWALWSDDDWGGGGQRLSAMCEQRKLWSLISDTHINFSHGAKMQCSSSVCWQTHFPNHISMSKAAVGTFFNWVHLCMESMQTKGLYNFLSVGWKRHVVLWRLDAGNCAGKVCCVLFYVHAKTKHV